MLNLVFASAFFVCASNIDVNQHVSQDGVSLLLSTIVSLAISVTGLQIIFFFTLKGHVSD